MDYRGGKREVSDWFGADCEGAMWGRLRRLVRDTTSIQRGIIRHVYLVIDLSMAMLVREFKATWLDITIQYAKVSPPSRSSSRRSSHPQTRSPNLPPPLTGIRHRVF